MHVGYLTPLFKSALHNNNSKFPIKSNIFSTDKGDCEKYNLKYNHIFYPIELHKDWDPSVSNNVYFIGADKGRAEKLLSFHQLFKSCGLSSNIHIFSSTKDPAYLDRYHEILTNTPINYAEYIKEILQNGILLDINQKGQRAITMRVLESVVYSKKLITTNSEVKSFPFYNRNNILLIDADTMPSAKTIQDFVSMPFIPYTDEQLYEISFEHWIKGF